MTRALITLGLIGATVAFALTGHHGLSVGFAVLTGMAILSVF